jgi:hypothetical protein
VEDKKSYSPEEVAQFCESYLKAHKGDLNSEEMRKYEKLVPRSVRNAMGILRDIEWGFYSNEPERRKAIKNLENFKSFEEFFKVYDGL